MPAGAAADHSVRRAGGHPDRAGPHVERRRDHGDARGRRLEPQGDRAGAGVRRASRRSWPASPRSGWRRSPFARARGSSTGWICTQLTAEIQPRVFEESSPTPSSTSAMCGGRRPRGALAQRLHGRRDAARAAHSGHARQGRRAADHGGARGDRRLRPGATTAFSSPCATPARTRWARTAWRTTPSGPAASRRSRPRPPSRTRVRPSSEMNTRQLLPLRRQGPDLIEAAHRAAPPLRAAGRLPDAGAGRHSARHLLAQGRQVLRLRDGGSSWRSSATTSPSSA